jgi:hypothetical protein
MSPFPSEWLRCGRKTTLMKCCWKSRSALCTSSRTYTPTPCAFALAIEGRGHAEGVCDGEGVGAGRLRLFKGGGGGAPHSGRRACPRLLRFSQGRGKHVRALESCSHRHYCGEGERTGCFTPIFSKGGGGGDFPQRCSAVYGTHAAPRHAGLRGGSTCVRFCVVPRWESGLRLGPGLRLPRRKASSTHRREGDV